MTHSHLFTSRTSKTLASLAAGAAIFASAFSSPVAANAAGGAYYPSGPQLNVPRSTVTNGGWKLCWSEEIGHAGADHFMELADIMAGTADGSVGACSGGHLMLTGWDTANPNVLPVLAAAPRTAVLTETPIQVTAGEAGRPVTFTPTTIQANGSQWYNYPGLSMGFRDAVDPAPPLWAWDIEQPQKSLSWFLMGAEQIYSQPLTIADLPRHTALGMGGSMGSYFANSMQPGGFTMAIFTDNAALRKGSTTSSSAFASWFKMSLPSNGHFSLTVSDDSSATCRVVNNKVFAFAAGSCSVTLTSLKSNGDVKATKTQTYQVK